MQESWQPLHDEQDSNSKGGKGGEDNCQAEESAPAPWSQTQVHHHAPKYFWQLCTRKQNDVNIAIQMET